MRGQARFKYLSPAGFDTENQANAYEYANAVGDGPKAPPQTKKEGAEMAAEMVADMEAAAMIWKMACVAIFPTTVWWRGWLRWRRRRR